MPVIVVGADTETGMAIVERLNRPGREVRAFVTDPDAANRLRGRGVKVALGDVSDDSHVHAAMTGCFSAVLIGEAAGDGRGRSFATTTDQVLSGWAGAAVGGGVRRVIWVHSGVVPEVVGREVAQVEPHLPDLVDRVDALDDAQSI